MRKVIIIILAMLLMGCFVGCGNNPNEKVVEKTQEIENAFSSKNMPAIKTIVFGCEEQSTTKTELLEGRLDSKTVTNSPQKGFLESIFSQVSIKTVDTSDDTVEFEISAPDMSKVFVELGDRANSISSDDLRLYLIDYASKAPQIKSKVLLPYKLVGDDIEIDYRNEVFINAVTGGLLDAYKALYTQMIEEYKNGGN